MSAPWDRERAWRSCGTAREASWQNSDFSIDHRLKHKNARGKNELCGQAHNDFHEHPSFLVFVTHTKGSASSPGCRLRTGGDLYERGTDTLHGDTGSSDSSSC